MKCEKGREKYVSCMWRKREVVDWHVTVSMVHRYATGGAGFRRHMRETEARVSAGDRERHLDT